jgi:hypothetical protein
VVNFEILVGRLAFNLHAKTSFLCRERFIKFKKASHQIRNKTLPWCIF